MSWGGGGRGVEGVDKGFRKVSLSVEGEEGQWEQVVVGKGCRRWWWCVCRSFGAGGTRAWHWRDKELDRSM